MAFGMLTGNREFMWYWNDTNHGWGTRIIKVPNYAAGMQRWRGRLTQTRDNITFDDTDGALIAALDDSNGKALEHEFTLYGRLDTESWGTLFSGVCKTYAWNAGVLEMGIANRFEELRSGRFQSNYEYLNYYDMTPLRVQALNGTEVALKNPLVIDRGRAIAYGTETDIVRFLATNSILVFDASDDPSSVSDPWEFTVAGFPQKEGTITATSIAMRLNIETAVGQGDYIYAPEDKTFTDTPQTLIREFLSGTSTDIGWTEGEDFVMGTTSVLDQVELTVPVNYRANSDVSVLSVLDHICETTLISAWPDRLGTCHFVPHTQLDLSDPPDGSMNRETGFNSLRYNYDSEEVVTTIDLYYGYDSDADSALNEWGGHKTFAVPSHWPDQLAIQRTRTMQARYLFHPDVARAMSLRILGRHFKGVPQLELQCLPTAATVTIGDIETITYTLLDLDTAYYEVTAIRDNWESDTIAVTLQAGTTIYEALGFGLWEDGDWGVDHAVSGTSKFGWGDGVLGGAVGTCNGIDETMYGSTWRWGG